MLEKAVNGLCNKRSKACMSCDIIGQISDFDHVAQLYTATIATTTHPEKLSRISILAVASCGIVMNSNYCTFNFFLKLSLPWRIPRCLGHVVNLGNTDVMPNITLIVAVENGMGMAIWEYDLTRCFGQLPCKWLRWARCQSAVWTIASTTFWMANVWQVYN